MQNNNETIIANNNNFKDKTLEMILEELKNKSIIYDNEKEELLNLYKKDNRDLSDIMDEIQNLNREELLKKINVKKQDEEDKSNKISLENVKDFSRDGKSFILIHYPLPSSEIKVVENYSNRTAKELFEEHKDENGLISVNGFVSSTDVYESSVAPEKNEVKMHNVTELAQSGRFHELPLECKYMIFCVLKELINSMNDLDEVQKAKLNDEPLSNLVQMFDKNVYVSPKEKIVIVCEPNDPSKDEIKSVVKDSNGKYKLTSLNAYGYNFINGENSSSVENNNENDSLDDSNEKGTSLAFRKPKKKLEEHN